MRGRKLDITKLTYPDMNAALLACEDVGQLQRWLTETVASGLLYRALRVHGRMNCVRRAQEISDIKAKTAAVSRLRKDAAA